MRENVILPAYVGYHDASSFEVFSLFTIFPVKFILPRPGHEVYTCVMTQMTSNMVHAQVFNFEVSHEKNVVFHTEFINYRERRIQIRILDLLWVNS